jgi:hypothetical protein
MDPEATLPPEGKLSLYEQARRGMAPGGKFRKG